MPDQFLPPTDEQLEISVFGPGYGESVLIHIGKKLWIVIDSCKDSAINESAPLAYLKKLGFNPAKDIKLVVASHWHDDHIKGLHEIFEAASSAQLCCASVLTEKEFLTLANIYASSGGKISKGPEELYKCICTAEARTKNTNKQHQYLASPDRPILVVNNQSLHVRLTTLSPSDEMINKSRRFMIDYVNLLKKGITDPRLNTSYPNDVAVALLLEINDRQILLGSDLEEDGSPLVGWSAVMSGVAAPNSKSCFYKVAHHGSKSGHYEPVWNDILHPQPLAFLTSFRYGRHKIPTVNDRSRILALTSNAYISSNPNAVTKAFKRTPKLQAIINLTVKNLTPINPVVGHIRWRAPIADASDPGSVDLFNGAMKLADVI
jgi:beta-lactamase superfamily II metal-dependent hydrolase